MVNMKINMAKMETNMEYIFKYEQRTHGKNKPNMEISIKNEGKVSRLKLPCLCSFNNDTNSWSLFGL